MLVQLCEKREEGLAGIPTDAIIEESDKENDSASPIFDHFHGSGGSQTFLDMCNFDCKKIKQLVK